MVRSDQPGGIGAGRAPHPSTYARSPRSRRWGAGTGAHDQLTGVAARGAFLQSLQQRIVESVDAPIDVRDAVANVGVSVGVAVGLQGVEAADLVARADAAMYEAKRGGKRQVAHYDAELERRLVERRQLARELVEAARG